MNKKFYLKTNLIGFIIGVIIFGGLAVYASVTFPSNEVSYDNSSSGLSSTNVKGAIDELYKTCSAITSDDLIKKLTKDPYECRYFFTSKNPNNYITFNNEQWRIISVECDGSIKILRDDILTEQPFDYREDLSGIYGTNYYPSSQINSYLNNTYLNELLNQDKIINHDWSIGSVEDRESDLKTQVEDEVENTWNGKIGLITASEFLRTNSNQETCGTLWNNDYNYEQCQTTNWMYTSESSWMTLTPGSRGTPAPIFAVNQYGRVGLGSVTSSHGVRPSLYLSSDVVLGGTGTQSDPYTIS